MSRLLIIDDSANFLRVFSIAMRNLGYEVTSCRNADQVLSMARGVQPDLVILDIGVSGDQGVDLLQSLRGSVGLADVPVLVLTAKTTRDDVVRCLRLGAVGFLVKGSVTLDVIRSRIESCLLRVGKTPPDKKVAFDLTSTAVRGEPSMQERTTVQVSEDVAAERGGGARSLRQEGEGESGSGVNPGVSSGSARQEGVRNREMDGGNDSAPKGSDSSMSETSVRVETRDRSDSGGYIDSGEEVKSGGSQTGNARFSVEEETKSRMEADQDFVSEPRGAKRLHDQDSGDLVRGVGARASKSVASPYRFDTASWSAEELSRSPGGTTSISQAESENHYLQLLGRMTARKTLSPEDMEILKVLKKSKIGVSVLLEGMGLDSFLETRFMELSLQTKFFEIQPTHTLVQTVKAVGLSASRNLTYAFFLIGLCSPEPPLDPVDFWLHALTTALLSRELALCAGAEDDVEVFSAGLIHDIGKTYLQGMDPALYAQVIEESWKARRPLKECEEDAFGISHTAAGRRVWVGWAVPPVVSSLAAFHHRTWDKVQDVNVRRRSHAALWMGNVLAKASAIGQAGDEVIPEVPKDIVSCLGLETERCLTLGKKIESQVQSLLHIVLLHLPIESIRSARQRISIPRLSSSLVYIDIEPPIVDPLVMTMRRFDPEARIVNRIDDVFAGQVGLAVFSIRSRKGVRLLGPVLESLREQEVPCLLLSPPSLELPAGPERVVRSPFRVAELVQALHELDAGETPEPSE